MRDDFASWPDVILPLTLPKRGLSIDSTDIGPTIIENRGELEDATTNK